MNKILVSSTLAALMAVTFSGCSDKEAEPAKKPVAITECNIL